MKGPLNSFTMILKKRIETTDGLTACRMIIERAAKRMSAGIRAVSRRMKRTYKMSKAAKT